MIKFLDIYWRVWLD